jgi:hypothetical protein
MGSRLPHRACSIQQRASNPRTRLIP